MGFFTPSSKASQPSPAASAAAGSRYLLWIDGVGSFLVFLPETLRIGGPGDAESQDHLGSKWADLALLANLSRHHATVVRSGESYFLEARAPAFCNQKAVNERVLLTDHSELRLNTDTILTFRQPTVLSATACLDLTSYHQPQQRLDGIVLLADSCLLGPSRENHVVCPHWAGAVILYRQGEQILCRSKLEIYVNEEPASEGAVLSPGSLVTGPELRFRWEVIS